MNKKRDTERCLFYILRRSLLFLIESHAVVEHVEFADQVVEQRVLVAVATEDGVLQIVLLEHQVLRSLTIAFV